MTSPLKPFNSIDLYSTPRRISEFSKDRISLRTLSKLASKENEQTVEGHVIAKTRTRSVTPMISKTQANLISNLETCNRSSDKAVSPNLANVRMTPGPNVQEKQKLLQEKHQRAKESVDRLAVGGGVSLWPEMDSMRLSAEEGVVLGLLCVVVTFATCYLFKYLHGSLLHSMRRYTAAVDGFSAVHPISWNSQAALDHSLLIWHSHFLQLLDEIKKQFETHLMKAHATYLIYLVLYVSAIATLLYYLIDNVIQKSKLTPRRMKVWVLLLVATASWTLLTFHLLVSYQRLEQSIEETVWRLLDERAHLAIMDLNLKIYRNVATYWKEHCLPPLSRGTLSVFGMVPVRDVFFYLQYYSVPILTALCTPILKLLMALKEMYIDPHRVHPKQRPLSRR